MRDEEHLWQLAAAASLASGASAKVAVSNADSILAAFKSRFPREPEDDD